ncbi:MAG TPA: hypothetical protein VGM53_35115 [Streptosporangiaceae bacterium]|jgi:hypothetical protein
MNVPGDSVGTVARELERAMEYIRGLDDADDRWREASRLGELLKRVLEDAGSLRAAMALRIHQDEGLSLGQLGRRLGISKARADQLVRQARKQDHRAGLVQVQQVTLSVQIPGETGIRLSEAAEAAGQSAGHLVDQALRAYLAGRGAEM